jgi:hypothetical protein
MLGWQLQDSWRGRKIAALFPKEILSTADFRTARQLQKEIWE